MQSEEFDRKIKEAADNHHPAYDEQAWMKMEKLLDKYLPQKKDDRRRFIFFLLLFLLLGGGAATVFFTGNGRKKDQSSIADSRATVQQPGQATPGKNESPENQKNKNSNADIDNKEPGGSNAVNNNTSASYNTTATGFDKISVKVVVKNEQKTNTAITDGGNKNNNLNQPSAVNADKPVTGIDIKNNWLAPVKENNNNSAVGISSAVSNNELKEKNADQVVNKNIIPELNKPLKKEEATTAQAVTEKPVKIKNKKSNSISFNFSAGPDISNAGSGKPGRAKLLAGAGLQYTFKDRFTIRTGFYTSRKIYSASEAEYHAPAIFYVYYPYFEKVDADCKVYEIPLSLSYNFNKSAKQSWFVSAGLSSYFMRSESYNYYYKTAPSGPIITRKWLIKGENKHYFSVLNLSGGYQKNISKSVSLTVEPYLKLPLKGIGYGKVKLNSSGVLFTIGIKPFDLFKKGK